jgi:two-component system, sensor histidine kinase and response regulator
MFIRFADGQRKTLEELRTAVSTVDCRAARGHSHALAGAAGNLGADELRDAAKALELAAKDGQQNLSDLFREVALRADIVFHSIDALRPPAPADSGTGTAAATAINPAQLRPPLERLQAALADFDLSGSAETLQEISRLNLPAELRGKATRLQELIDAYEYDEAGQIVKQLLDGLPKEPPS